MTQQSSEPIGVGVTVTVGVGVGVTPVGDGDTVGVAVGHAQYCAPIGSLHVLTFVAWAAQPASHVVTQQYVVSKNAHTQDSH